MPEQLSIKSGMQPGIVLILLNFVRWLVQKTGDQSDAKLKTLTTQSREFSRALST